MHSDFDTEQNDPRPAVYTANYSVLVQKCSSKARRCRQYKTYGKAAQRSWALLHKHFLTNNCIGASMETTGQGREVRNRLLDDLKLVIQDAEDLLRSTGQQVDESYQTARTRFESTLGNVRSGLSTLEERVQTGSREAMDTTEQYMQQHPWQSVGVSALAGLIVGLWLGRR
jgi:ElaB/YqjD/DUF883 family membrane-anchored ribosome-binding protein